MVKFVRFFSDGTYTEYERSFPGGAYYAAERLREHLFAVPPGEGFFVYDQKHFAIIEPGIFLFQRADTVTMTWDEAFDIAVNALR